MAEVGRELVCDPGGLLPGGFWAAVAVWLERPQVANKRLCGARLEARRSVTLPRASAGWDREGPGPERSSVEGHLGPRPALGPEEDTTCRRHEGTQDQRPHGKEQSKAAVAPLLAEHPGQLQRTGDEDDPAADLDSLWDRFSRSLVSSHPEMLSFLTCPRTRSLSEAPHELDLVLRTVIPKKSPYYLVTAPRREIVVQDVPNGTVTFLPLEEDEEESLKVKMSNVYQIRLSRSQAEWFISVLIFCPEKWHADGVTYPRVTWLGEELLGRLARWCVAPGKSEFRSTLSLVSITRYSTLYQELKEKYRALVKVWPEVTDPEKFVFEDVAIAAYLLILWEEERAERGVSARQSFVDLGCGNGLLVHILCSEGHPGRGIDVRRRKIWDMYGPHTQLEEVAITPSDQTLFPDADWLLGNHSDELTPWVPVIAARSSYRCRFFVLPCCFFDFVGKYRRRQSRKTQYREYLDFVVEVGQACGFHVEEDCLRIPSTKRVCLIGKRRTYPPAAEASVDEQRTRYIRSRRGLSGRNPSCPAPQATACPADLPDGNRDLDTGAQSDLQGPVPECGTELQVGEHWLLEFHPREKAERVRNCATLPRDFIDQVVLQVANLLLGQKKSPEQVTWKTWNGGESLSLAEVARQLDRATLQRLKHECGGLQTLLRNNHQVFRVLDGRVHIRDWRRELQREKRSEAFKTRACWFFTHHPEGCALPSASCPFAHGPQELRPPRFPKKKTQSP